MTKCFGSVIFEARELGGWIVGRRKAETTPQESFEKTITRFATGSKNLSLNQNPRFQPTGS